jgi:hypothetical protein
LKATVGISEQELINAIRAVGPSAKKVEAYLKEKRTSTVIKPRGRARPGATRGLSLLPYHLSSTHVALDNVIE